MVVAEEVVKLPQIKKLILEHYLPIPILPYLASKHKYLFAIVHFEPFVVIVAN